METKAFAKRVTSAFQPDRHSLIHALLSWMAICFSPGVFHGGNTPLAHAIYNILFSWKPFDLDKILLLPALVLLFAFCDRKLPLAEWKRPSLRIPAILFALCFVLGTSYEAMDSWWQALEWRNGQLLKSVFLFIGYDLLSSRAIAIIYLFIDKLRVASPSVCTRENWYSRQLRAHPFRTVFLTLFICYIPHLLISAPAMFMGDTWGSICQAYPVLRTTGTNFILPEQMLNPEVFLNQAMPVFFTLLLHAFIAVGDQFFGSMNWGLFLYTVFQLACVCATFAWCTSILLRKGYISLRYAFVFPIYGLFHPMIYNYSTLTTKDTFYSISLMLFLTSLFLLVSGQKQKSVKIRAILAGCGAVLFRNEGRIPVLLGCLVCVCLCKEQRKSLLQVGLFLLTFSLLTYNLLYPALSFTPGSRREVLSIPLQQVARFVRDYGADVTESERDIIGKVLAYPRITIDYDPNTSDPMKIIFNERCTTEELFQFLGGVWVKLFFRHPDAYIQAWINNYYEFLYPAQARIELYTYDWSQGMYDYTNLWLENMDRSISSWPVTEFLRVRSDSFLPQLAAHNPLLSVFLVPAVYTWIYFICAGYAIRTKNRQLLSLLSFPLILILLCFMNPLNGSYGRYYLTIVFMLPLLIPILQIGSVHPSSSTAPFSLNLSKEVKTL